MKKIDSRIYFCFLCLLFTLNGCFSRWANDNSHLFPGTYQIDTARTEFGNCLECRQFDTLKLSIYKDGRFSFNIFPDFIYDDAGLWEKDGGGVNTYFTITYNRGFKNQIGMETDYKYISINSPVPLNRKHMVKVLVFRKIGDTPD